MDRVTDEELDNMTQEEFQDFLNSLPGEEAQDIREGLGIQSLANYFAPAKKSAIGGGATNVEEDEEPNWTVEPHTPSTTKSSSPGDSQVPEVEIMRDDWAQPIDPEYDEWLYGNPDEEEMAERNYQRSDYLGHWYDAHPAPLYEFEPYVPEGRFYSNRPLLMSFRPLREHNDWYFKNGIPHEVRTPRGEWRSLKLWMMQVARCWWQTVQQPPVPQDMFAGAYDIGQINFFRVMRSRIDRQVKCAFWTRFARRRHQAALGLTPFTPSAYMRKEIIMYSLTGVDGPLANGDGSEEVPSLIRFVRSPAVMGPWLEFIVDWLRYNPYTTNPIWSMIQPALANPDIADSRRRIYGRGNLLERRVMSKEGWTLEDHAMRFIISLYRLGRTYLASAGIGPDDVLDGWKACLFRGDSTPDVNDRHWFGYSLLMLLIASWQFNQLYPTQIYRRMKIPALLDGFVPYEFRLPRPEVGTVDLSPFSPWVVHDNYQSPLDMDSLWSLGICSQYEIGEMWERESETELGDNGARLPFGKGFIPKKSKKSGKKAGKKAGKWKVGTKHPGP